MTRGPTATRTPIRIRVPPAHTRRSRHRAVTPQRKSHTVKLYQRLTPVLNTLKGCLASGYPFVFGFTVYESFESPQVAKTGIVPMPGPTEKVVGGHAVVCVGYDDTKQQFIVRNSWGDELGNSGLLPDALCLFDGLKSGG